MTKIAERTHERIQRARLEVQPTRSFERPQQPNVPEPYPPPGEGDPPEPATVPEPFPSPDEGDPPRPAIVPEPTPGGPQED